tara:strand:+ start:699 stop:821 length:123 start_codon:yes stop_codon:yes gene_type:complete
LISTEKKNVNLFYNEFEQYWFDRRGRSDRDMDVPFVQGPM